MRLVLSDQPLGTRFPAVETVSRGAGYWSSFIEEKEKDAQKHMEGSIALYGDVAEIEGAVYEIANVAADKDWDGDGADPVTPRTVECALLLAKSLPAGLPRPEVYAEARGEITFEWYTEPRRTILISVFDTCEIGYAALLGDERTSRKHPFIGELSPELTNLLRRVVL